MPEKLSAIGFGRCIRCLDTISPTQPHTFCNRYSTSQQVQDVLTELGWTKRQLAEQLGVDRRAVQKWVSRESLPSLAHIGALRKLQVERRKDVEQVPSLVEGN